MTDMGRGAEIPRTAWNLSSRQFHPIAKIELDYHRKGSIGLHVAAGRSLAAIASHDLWPYPIADQTISNASSWAASGPSASIMGMTAIAPLFC